MRPRQRQQMPPFFNLSLLDVICNALGAVIFLMFLSYWQASRVSQQLQASIRELDTKKRDLEKTNSQLAELLDLLDTAKRELAQREQQLQETAGRLVETEKSRQQIQRSAEELALQLRGERFLRQEYQKKLSHAQALARDLEVRAQDAAEQLRRLQGEHGQLASEFQKALAHMATLEKQLHQTETDRSSLSKTLADLRRQMRLQQALVAEQQHALQIRRSELADLHEQLAQAQTREKALKAQLAQLEKNLDAVTQGRADLRERLERLRKENQRLSEQLVLAERRIEQAQTKLQQIEKEARKRFAGVDLTGKRVIFLVDTSGSMGKRDPSQDDPKKWQGVCETVRHVMASMTNLEHFQLITFSSKVDYPLHGAGQWLKFDRDYSALQAFEALMKIRPEGGTNLHLAFEEAFKYHTPELALDTIMLFSDGLPTESPDMTLQEQQLGNQDRERLLAPRLLKRIAQWNQPIGQPPRVVRIDAIGFYYDSPNLGNFLWSLVRENHGSFIGMSQP